MTQLSTNCHTDCSRIMESVLAGGGEIISNDFRKTNKGLISISCGVKEAGAKD